MTVEVGADERTRRHAGAGEGEAGSLAPARGQRWATKCEARFPQFVPVLPGRLSHSVH